MSRIENYCIKRPTNDGHYINASGIPFVRTDDGKQICARDESGHLQVYLNNPKVVKYKIDSAFRRSETVRSFYQRALNIPEYNIEQETVENILPKYNSRQVEFKTSDPIRENIEDLKVIKDAIYTNPLILDKLADKFIVTDGKDWYLSSEIYIKSNDVRSGYSLVDGIVDFVYLSHRYFDDTVLNIKLDEEFFKKIGCNYGIKTLPVKKEQYLKAVRKYQGPQAERELSVNIFQKRYISYKMDWAFVYEGFPEVFQNMTRAKSLAIALFLNPNAMNFDIKGELVGADDQLFTGKNVHSSMAYSMIGMMLCFEKWIYIQNDDKPHSPLEVDKDNLLLEYKAAKRLISILPFKEVNTAMNDWIKMTYDSQEDRERIKYLLSRPEELAKIADAMVKNEAAQEAKRSNTRSVRDLIESGDREQKESGPSEGDLEISPISEKGKRTREENLDKEFAASLENFTSVARGLQFCSRTSNKEEREFLLQEYDGHCQICLKQIKKCNGERYFEAINIIKFSKLPEKIANSIKYGWNSLSLCPNCAAEYNYASKKISTIYEQIMSARVEPGSEETIDVDIELPMGKAKKIRYSPRHFIALKEALIVFAEEE